MTQLESVTIEGPPQRLEQQHARIFTKDAKRFLLELISEFDAKVDALLLERERRRIEIAKGNWQPQFKVTNQKNWTIAPIPKRIQNRKLDLGDISPANTILFTDALYADVQGIQVCTENFFYERNSRVCSFFPKNRLILMMVTVQHGAIQ